MESQQHLLNLTTLELVNMILDLQEELEQVKGAYDDRVGDITALEYTLREIDTHIRSDREPVKYIIEALKATLPEYQYEWD